MTRATSVLFWFALTILVSIALYDTSYRVQNLRHEVTQLNAQIEDERRNIHVLKAEWVYLANPSRIEAAARKYLALQPTAPRQIISLQDLPEVLGTPAPRFAAVPASKPSLAAAQARKPAPQVADAAPEGFVHDQLEDHRAYVLANSGRVP